MTGYHFYLEFPTMAAKRKSGKSNAGHSGNVFALSLPRLPNFVDGTVEGLGAVYERPNSPVATTAYAPYVLHCNCKRVPEKVAREIHPALFDRLAEEGDDDNDY